MTKSKKIMDVVTKILANKSYMPPDHCNADGGGHKMNFVPGMGYVIPSGPMSTTEGVMIDYLCHMTPHRAQLLVGKRTMEQLAKLRCLEKEEQRRMSRSERERETEGVLKHAIYNLYTDEIIQCELLLISCQIALRTEVYRTLVTNPGVGVRRSPFQQLMAFDTICAMINRSDMRGFTHYIFMRLRHSMDCMWLSPSVMTRFLRLLQRHQVVAYNVRRQMGKTVAVRAEITKQLCLFPLASVKAMYVAHKHNQTNETMRCVNGAIQDLLRVFNRQQKAAYDKRKLLLSSGVVDIMGSGPRDRNSGENCPNPCWEGTSVVAVQKDAKKRKGKKNEKNNNQEVGVVFVDVGSGGNSAKRPMRNLLWCVAYNINVSMGFIFYTLYILLFTSMTYIYRTRPTFQRRPCRPRSFEKSLYTARTT